MEEIDLKELFTMFWEKKVIVILLTIIFAVLGIIYTAVFVTPMYKSTTSLLLVQTSKTDQNDAAITTSDITLNSKLVSTYSELIRSKKITRQVISNLGINLKEINENTLKNNISVNAKEDTELIEISVKNPKPEYAADIANEIAKVFSEEVKALYGIDNVAIIDQAEVSNEPSNISYKKNIAVFAFIGIAISCGYVFIANMLDNTIKSAEAIEKKYNLFVLASIPIYSTNLTKGGKR